VTNFSLFFKARFFAVISFYKNAQMKQQSVETIKVTNTNKRNQVSEKE